MSILDRALAGLEGGALEVTLPDGTARRFGKGAPVRLDIRDRGFFRRVATRGKVGFGEAYTAGEWETDDLVGLFELLLQNADAAGARHARVRRLLSCDLGSTAGTACCGRAATSPTTTTSGTTSSR